MSTSKVTLSGNGTRRASFTIHSAASVSVSGEIHGHQSLFSKSSCAAQIVNSKGQAVFSRNQVGQGSTSLGAKLNLAPDTYTLVLIGAGSGGYNGGTMSVEYVDIMPHTDVTPVSQTTLGGGSNNVLASASSGSGNAVQEFLSNPFDPKYRMYEIGAAGVVLGLLILPKLFRG